MTAGIRGLIERSLPYAPLHKNARQPVCLLSITKHYHESSNAKAKVMRPSILWLIGNRMTNDTRHLPLEFARERDDRCAALGRFGAALSREIP